MGIIKNKREGEEEEAEGMRGEEGEKHTMVLSRVEGDEGGNGKRL